MEVDWCATDEVKEGSDRALLHEQNSDESATLNSLQQIHHGQIQKWTSRHHLTPTPHMLTDTPVSYACWCVGVPLVSVGSTPRVDSAGYPACEECGTRLNRCKGKLHKHDKGKICSPCYKATRTVGSCVPMQQRQKRPYDSLQPTQKWKRRKQAREAVTQVLEDIGVPLEEIHPPSIPSPIDLAHLPTSVRENMRTVRGLRIPSEKLMIKCKKLLANTHATETGTLANGAYITDPVRFVSVLCAQSPFIAIGGDGGGKNGKRTNSLPKLGITYSIQDTQHFAALMVYEGSDSWEDLNYLTTTGLTPFTGDSASFPHIFTILQHLIDTHSAFLNGDCPFILM